MNMKILYCLAGLLAAPAFATVEIVSTAPSPQSPQPIGTTIQWTVTATDTNAGPQQSPNSPLGSPGCQPADCNSRGMALNIDEATFTVTPALMVNLGVYSPADGAAQSLVNDNYFFFAALVATSEDIKSHALETGGGDGSWALDIQGPQGYRAFRMSTLYNPN